jgi:hypothetical protein
MSYAPNPPAQQPQATQPTTRRSTGTTTASNNNTNTANNHHPPPKPKTNAKIWSTSTTEERERIKEFWLGLGEEERRNLVKVEKDTVLRKMKEQQRHSCSCAVCGRKRYENEMAFMLYTQH